MKYLDQTNNFAVMLHADNLKLLLWYVDRTHTAHIDCKGHTGGKFTLGKGTLCNISKNVSLKSHQYLKYILAAVFCK